MYTTLNHRVTIYVPSTYEGNKPARRMARKATAHTARVFSALFGGATATKAAGYWVSDTKGLTKETQTLVFSACTEADKEANFLPNTKEFLTAIKNKSTFAIAKSIFFCFLCY